MEIKGKVIEISETTPISATFRKREFVVEYAENPQYPEFIKFELIQDKCELLDVFEVGKKIEVHFNLKGRKWTDKDGVVKYFNSLQAWRLVSLDDTDKTEGPSSSAKTVAQSGQEEKPGWLEQEEGMDDLPF
jgi:hypothetical protein